MFGLGKFFAMLSEFDKNGDYCVVRKGTRVFRVSQPGIGGMSKKKVTKMPSSSPNSLDKLRSRKTLLKSQRDDEVNDITIRKFTDLELSDYRNYTKLLDFTSDPDQYVSRGTMKKLKELEKALLNETRKIIGKTGGTVHVDEEKAIDEPHGYEPFSSSSEEESESEEEYEGDDEDKKREGQGRRDEDKVGDLRNTAGIAPKRSTTGRSTTTRYGYKKEKKHPTLSKWKEGRNFDNFDESDISNGLPTDEEKEQKEYMMSTTGEVGRLERRTAGAERQQKQYTTCS